ncbi:hypothetical protein LHJ74_18520 [Streptomyces sp. N2-109]|uniref:Secreted protein n=1 Tax=Streptomyces gossypii TaxID=2883101 RepID=A0ABT2JVE0_9ACTN|nr:hypothetical protein [Streptomyces gossypii]MCT2591868.1 hypothetical protein [Streptomyces gossypii]
MAALLWLLIPVSAGLVASVWGGFAARRRTSTPDADGVAGYERFREAMERTPSSSSPRSSRSSRLSRRGSQAAEPAAALTRPATDGPAREAR